MAAWLVGLPLECDADARACAVQVFDLRMLRLTTPITFSTPHGPGPVFTRFFPQYSSTVVIGGVTGRFQIQDITDAGLPMYFAVRGAPFRPLVSHAQGM